MALRVEDETGICTTPFRFSGYRPQKGGDDLRQPVHRPAARPGPLTRTAQTNDFENVAPPALRPEHTRDGDELVRYSTISNW